MRQSLEILRMPWRDLDELVKKECAKNPAIEVDERRGSAIYSNRGLRDVHREFLENIADETPLDEHLLLQVPDWPDGKKEILSKLLEFIDEMGFFDGDVREIAESLGANPGEVEWVYGELKSLHPHGIGAKNLRESLLLQLNQREIDGEGRGVVELAKTILGEHFQDLQAGKIDSMCKKLHIPRVKVMEAGKLIARLNFSPISGFSNERNVTIIPDLRIFKSSGEWVVECNSDILPVIRFSDLYKNTIGSTSTADRKTLLYLRRQSKVGRFLRGAIERRRSTLLGIGGVILSRQLEFFECGAKYMKPLRLKDVAEETKLHISTISRAVHEKYVHTPHGVIPMAKFFDSGAPESVSKGAIMERIREILGSHGGKLSDEKIAKILKQSGINVARRTVTKYRDAMNIPSSMQGHLILS
jgi:RNA polymerase sigma-54 factor